MDTDTDTSPVDADTVPAHLLNTPSDQLQPRLLIVDDEEINLLSVEMLLEDLGLVIDKVRSGSEAIAKVRLRDYFLVLMDVQMPGMDGFEAAAWIHRQEATANLPIIFITGLDNDEFYIKQGYATGAVDYIHKPVNEEMLRSKVVVFKKLWQQQAQLMRLNEQLMHSNRELEQFAYIASHDLQEPLRMMSSYLSVLQKHYSDDPDENIQTYFHFAVDGAQRMQALITSLLDYSRLRSVDARPVEVYLGDCVMLALRDLGDLVARQHADIVVGDLPMVLGDENQLQRLFLNLLGNALKFVAQDRQPHVEVSAQAEGTHWRVDVQDNGIGIAPQDQRRIFLLFERLNGPARFDGSGIGLATCQRIVQQHGGRISVASRLGEGSCFSVYFPQV